MKKIKRSIFKNFYFNIEKEENWLNDMANKGLVLSEIKNTEYIFEEDNNSPYQFKIDIFKDGMTNTEIDDYLSFFKEMNIDIVFRTKRFVYLRKLSTDVSKPFEIYSDIQSKIDFYNRYNILRYIFAAIFIFASLGSNNNNIVVIGYHTITIVIGLICLFSALSTQKKIDKLKLDQQIQE